MARTKGSRNVITGVAKDNIAAVFVRLGGTAAMAKWAQANKSEFYRIYARLIPLEHTGPDGQKLFEGLRIEFVGANRPPTGEI